LAKVVASKGLEEVLSNDGLGKSQGRPNFNVDTVVLAPTVIQEVNGIHVVPVSLHAVPPGQPRKGGRGLCGSQTGNSAAAGAGFSKFHGLDEGPPGFVPNTIHVDILKNPIVLHDFSTMQVGGKRTCCAGYEGNEDDCGSGVAENDAEFVFGRANLSVSSIPFREKRSGGFGAGSCCPGDLTKETETCGSE